MSTCLRCDSPIDPGAARTVGLLCATCTATVDEVRALASFSSHVDPANPRCQVVEIRRRRPADETTPDYHVTGDATSAALAHFCVYFLTSLGLLPDDIAEAIIEDVGPPPPTVVDAPTRKPDTAPPVAVIPPLAPAPVRGRKAEAVEAVNVCEHGDHRAPAGQRFCSPECQACDIAECDPADECARLCLPGVASRNPTPAPTSTLPPAPSAGKPKPRKEPRIALVTSAMGDRVATMPDDDEEPVS